MWEFREQNVSLLTGGLIYFRKSVLNFVKGFDQYFISFYYIAPIFIFKLDCTANIQLEVTCNFHSRG